MKAAFPPDAFSSAKPFASLLALSVGLAIDEPVLLPTIRHWNCSVLSDVIVVAPVLKICAPRKVDHVSRPEPWNSLP